MSDGRPAGPAGRSPAPARRRFSLDAVKGPIAALGLLLMAGALGYYLIFAIFDAPMRIMLAAGILLIGVAIAIDPEAVWGKMTARSALYGGNTLAIAALLLGILALINVLGSRRHERWDLTATRQFSLSDETIKVLGRIDQPIRVLGFFRDDTRKEEFEQLLAEYETRSGGKLSYEFVDVDRPAVWQEYGIREYGTTVLVMGERRQQITGTRESDLTTALLRLIDPQPKKAYFTTGHNERRLDGLDNDGYNQIKTSMEADNFTVEGLDLFASGAVPDDAGLVVVAGPKSPFTEPERQALSAYLDRGGKLMVLVDPRTDSGLAPLLARWSIEVGQAYVVETDPNAFGLGSPFFPVVGRFPVHKITEQMQRVLFPATTYVSAPQQTPAGAVMTSLAQTGDRSWAETDEAALRDPRAIRFDEGADTRGPLTLALAVEIRPETAPGAEPDPAAPKTRLVLLGTSNFVSNEFMALPIGNRDLFLNAANWLAEAEELISIRAKPTDTRTMFLSAAQRNTILYSTTLFLPLLVLAAGAAVWWSRR
jgi:ABC-type uncharacterized transport system involved in gliding motility auxiliary subunit